MSERLTCQAYYDLLVRSAGDGTFPSSAASSCYYRLNQTAECKQRCVVGLCIDDDKYDPWIENRQVTDLLDHVRINIPDGMTIKDLAKLQGVHDIRAFTREWDGKAFVEKINGLDCFYDMVKKEVCH